MANKMFGLLNGVIYQQSKKYSKRMFKTSESFNSGNIKCKNVRDNNIMLTRDVCKITDDKINNRQKSLKINIIMVVFFYMALIYFLVNTLV